MMTETDLRNAGYARKLLPARTPEEWKLYDEGRKVGEQQFKERAEARAADLAAFPEMQAALVAFLNRV